jgi:putative endonuclease
MLKFIPTLTCGIGTMATSKAQLGQRGEELAAQYLQRLGYAIVTRNWRCKQGEIDIIAEKDGALVFVEVRSRAAKNTDSAFESVGTQKQRRMNAAVYAYLDAHQIDEALWRIDVIAVAIPYSSAPIIDHVENALDW